MNELSKLKGDELLIRIYSNKLSEVTKGLSNENLKVVHYYYDIANIEQKQFMVAIINSLGDMLSKFIDNFRKLTVEQRSAFIKQNILMTDEFKRFERTGKINFSLDYSSVLIHICYIFANQSLMHRDYLRCITNELSSLEVYYLYNTLVILDDDGRKKLMRYLESSKFNKKLQILKGLEFYYKAYKKKFENVLNVYLNVEPDIDWKVHKKLILIIYGESNFESVLYLKVIKFIKANFVELNKRAKLFLFFNMIFNYFEKDEVLKFFEFFDCIDIEAKLVFDEILSAVEVSSKFGNYSFDSCSKEAMLLKDDRIFNFFKQNGLTIPNWQTYIDKEKSKESKIVEVLDFLVESSSLEILNNVCNKQVFDNFVELLSSFSQKERKDFIAGLKYISTNKNNIYFLISITNKGSVNVNLFYLLKCLYNTNSNHLKEVLKSYQANEDTIKCVIFCIKKSYAVLQHIRL